MWKRRGRESRGGRLRSLPVVFFFFQQMVSWLRREGLVMAPEFVSWRLWVQRRGGSGHIGLLKTLGAPGEARGVGGRGLEPLIKEPHWSGHTVVIGISPGTAVRLGQVIKLTHSLDAQI